MGHEEYLGIPIAPTRCMAEGDLLHLIPELKIVDLHFDSSQHKARRWEYAMALRSMAAWEQRPNRDYADFFYDVGGAGSPFCKMYPGWIQVIDPKETRDGHLAVDLKDSGAPTASGVFCISVVEHVEDLEDFCAHLARVTSPGGFLFLTSDIWGEAESEPDKAKWHWDRVRIFTPAKWRALYEGTFSPLGFALLGEADWRYHGALMRGEDGSEWGYSLASMALVKEK